MIMAGVGMLSVVSGPMVWIAVIMAGLVRDGFMAIFMTMIIETEGVGASYAGTAIGLVMSFNGLGTMSSPPLGNSLADIAPSFPFIFWAILAAAGFFGLYFAKEER
jgi:hypothetical protein